MSLSVIISMIVACVGIATFILSIVQSMGNTHVKRAQFFKEIIDRIRFDQDLVDAMNILDYDEDWYNDDFPKSDIETKMDKLFSYLSYVCYLHNVKVISNKEFELIEYKIMRACQNKNTQYYFKFVNRFAKLHNVKHTFNDMIEYMKVNVFNNDEKLINEFENGKKFAIKRDNYLLNPTKSKK